MPAGRERIAETQTIADKSARSEAEAEVSAAIHEELAEQFAEIDDAETQISAAIRSVTKDSVRKRIVEEEVRIDGRNPSELRTLSSDVGIIPTAHGSGLFQRGETQVMNVATLGTGKMDQMIDGIDQLTEKGSCTITISLHSQLEKQDLCEGLSAEK